VRRREVEAPHERLDVAGVAALDQRRELADGLLQTGRTERLTQPSTPSSHSTRTIVQS
jgi:hypothetical protein